MKEQNKTPEKELSKTETTNLLDAEFKTLLIRMIREFLECGKKKKKKKKKALAGEAQ